MALDGSRPHPRRTPPIPQNGFDEVTRLTQRVFGTDIALVSLIDHDRRPVCVVYADIDGLKAINDHGGHHDGDGAIIAAAKILKDSLREADIVARIGGDEFAALLYGADAASMEQPLARLSAALDVHNSQPAQLQPVALSLGWVQWVEGEDLDACLRRADEAMYGSKHHPSDSR